MTSSIASVCVFGLLGNGIVLWFLRLDIRKNPLFVYILSLAAADFFFLFLRLFITSFFFAQYFATHILQWCELMTILSKMEVSSFSSSMYFLTAISVERCLSPYDELSSVFYMLACINSSINPAIYFLVGFCRKRWFREPLQFIIQRSLSEEKEAEEERNVCCSTDRDIANSQVKTPKASVASVKPVGITGPVMTSPDACEISVFSSQL
ncbi:mas-related G-protein coupled receptor member X1-like [Podarcis raffonei]|uniref:mas-related G-protein coupled receptor member X1-like n=1 Tax=Podarcis raffonei TaxID=65483 RepID=UPI0023292BF0|nr:mas-related G-protein coupled receptor member X1-like [Podarcis raffonei]